MKNPIEMLKEIKTVLGIELSETKVDLAQMKLEDGTVLEAEAFEAENEVFIVSEDQKIALPVGEYALEDGKVLVVEDEGIIKEIKEVSGEEMPEEEAPMMETEEELAEEVQFATIDQLNELKAMIAELSEKLSKEEVSEELSEVPQDVEEAIKEDLSAPASEGIKHNPEKEQVSHKFSISSNKRKSLRDNILNKIAKINN